MNANALNLLPRYDLQIPGVILYYKKVHTQDGVPGLRYYQDKYPPTLSDWYPDARIHTIELLGSSQTTVRQPLKTAVINAAHATEATRLTWWKDRFPWLADANVSGLAIAAGSVQAYRKNNNTKVAVSLGEFPYEIIKGGITQWMEDQYDVNTVEPLAGFGDEVIIEALVDCTVNATTGVVSKKIKQRVVSYRCNVCDYESTDPQGDEFVTVAFNDPGEPVYIGLAQDIYESHQQLQYEGVINLVGDQIPDNLHLGQLLTINTPGGTYPDNLVQRITGELTRGRVSVAIGPPGHLGLTDMIELMRVNRYRLVYNLPSNASNPLAGSASDVRLSKDSPKENSTDGAGTASDIAATSTFEA